MSDELYSLIYLISELADIGFKAVVIVFMYLYIRRQNEN